MKALITNSKVDLSDVGLHYPERLGHLNRIVGLVSEFVSLPSCKVEIWDEVGGGCHGSYTPYDRLIKLWSKAPCLGLTLVHELSHSLMRLGPSEWDKWGGDKYLSDGEELFARAMSQWICIKTGDKTLGMQLEDVRNFHWTDSEFENLGIRRWFDEDDWGSC